MSEENKNELTIEEEEVTITDFSNDSDSTDDLPLVNVDEKEDNTASTIEIDYLNPKLFEDVRTINIDDLVSSTDESSVKDEVKDQYLGSISDISENQVLSGRVIGMNEKDILIDIGFKSEGMIDRAEFPEDAIPESKAGVGSATNDASREIGGALGIAIGGSVLNEIYQNTIAIPDSAMGNSGLIESSFPAAIKIGSQMLAGGNMEGADLIASAKEAFIEGMIGACIVAGCVALVAAFLVKWKMPEDDSPSKNNRL